MSTTGVFIPDSKLLIFNDDNLRDEFIQRYNESLKSIKGDTIHYVSKAVQQIIIIKTAEDMEKYLPGKPKFIQVTIYEYNSHGGLTTKIHMDNTEINNYIVSYNNDEDTWKFGIPINDIDAIIFSIPIQYVPDGYDDEHIKQWCYDITLRLMDALDKQGLSPVNVIRFTEEELLNHRFIPKYGTYTKDIKDIVSSILGGV